MTAKEIGWDASHFYRARFTVKRLTGFQISITLSIALIVKSY